MASKKKNSSKPAKKAVPKGRGKVGSVSDLEAGGQLQSLQENLRQTVAQMEQWGDWAQGLMARRDDEVAALLARVEALEQRLLRESGAEPRLTNAQKGEAITAYLIDPERSNWSDREIARQVGASPQTVANWRNRLSVTSHSGQDRGGQDRGGQDRTGQSRTVIRGGKVFKMRTDNIGQGKG